MRRDRWPRRFVVAATLALSLTLAAVPALLAQATPAEVALARLNFYRQAAGVGALASQAALTQAAAAHANYYLLNQQYTAHDESPGSPGFTGADPSARTLAAGYPVPAGLSGPCITENATSVGYSATAAVDGLVNTVFHRTSMLGPLWLDMGFGMTAFGTSIKLGSQTCNLADASQVITSPGAGQTGFPPAFAPHTERPDPLPTLEPLTPSNAAQVGGPISIGTRAAAILVGPGQNRTPPVIDLFEVTDQFGGKPSGFHVVDDRGWRYWMAFEPLNPGQTYTVHVRGSFGGQATGSFDTTWQFTTESAYLTDTVFLGEQPTQQEYLFSEASEPKSYFRFYRQTAGKDPFQTTQLWGIPGFRIEDMHDRYGEVGFLSKFEEIGFTPGGVPILGYPLSNVVSHRGVPIQFFQRGVLRRLGGQVEFLNIFDDLAKLPGVDAQLEAVSRIPKAIDHPQDAGKSIDEIEARRLEEVRQIAPAIHAFVTQFSPDVRRARYGLPVNWQVYDGNLVGVRFQRMGFRQGVGETNPNLVDQVLGGEKAKQFEVYLK